MQEELPKAYEAKSVEPKWRKVWKEERFSRANPNSSKPKYSLVMPPPNVTGVLHLGHALCNTLQDILVRYKKMKGFEVLWVPGTDHAGIATQTVVEKNLIRTTGKRRKDFSREEFLAHVFAWKDQSQKTILSQLEMLGVACDWSRLAFTMDDKRSKAVRVIFKKLFDQGLIYRGNYLVNWDPITQTALADDEVEYEEKEGFLYHIRYPLEDGSTHIVIATTRPETMLGDTAVCVHPDDERYQALIGKKVVLPLVGRKIPIVAHRSLDPAFGTGAMKTTPAHDPVDYQIGKELGLEELNVFTPDGRINEEGKEFAGLLIHEARDKIADALKREGFLIKLEPYTRRVGVSYRSKAVIEPMLSKQWFVKMDGFKDVLKKSLEDNKIKLVPENWDSTYLHWIDNLRDWCISRQLWWGHRIPVWYNKENPDEFICSDEEGIPDQIKNNPEKWVQDEDVLDTWFSSALWPFSTLGWPDNTDELKAFYPNSVLVTGHDILFFWVARMLAFGHFAMGELPFPATLLYGLIYGKSYWRKNPEGGITYLPYEERKQYDTGALPLPKDVSCKWEKLSKSKGNVIDPLEIIDEYGTDALRMSLSASPVLGRQIDLDRRKFEEFKNFANKVWNGARFVLMNLSFTEWKEDIDLSKAKVEDLWILEKLKKVTESVSTSIESFHFEKAALDAYDFFWKEFCAYYVECCKPTLFGHVGSADDKVQKEKLLLVVLTTSLQLLHPIAPFITEEILNLIKERFKTVKIQGQDALSKHLKNALEADIAMLSTFPEPSLFKNHSDAEKAFEEVAALVHAIRNIRGEMKVPPGSSTDVFLKGEKAPFYKEQESLVKALVKTKSINVVEQEAGFALSSTAIVEGTKVIIPLPEEMQAQEKERLKKEREKVEKMLTGTLQKLSQEDFVSKAPAEIVAKLKAQEAELKLKLSEIDSKL